MNETIAITVVVICFALSDLIALYMGHQWGLFEGIARGRAQEIHGREPTVDEIVEQMRELAH